MILKWKATRQPVSKGDKNIIPKEGMPQRRTPICKGENDILRFFFLLEFHMFSILPWGNGQHFCLTCLNWDWF